MFLNTSVHSLNNISLILTLRSFLLRALNEMKLKACLLLDFPGILFSWKPNTCLRFNDFRIKISINAERKDSYQSHDFL